MSPVRLAPVFPASAAPEGPRSMWVGEVDVTAGIPQGLTLDASAGFVRARLLVRAGDTPLDFIEVPVEDGCVAPEDLRAAMSAISLPGPDKAPRPSRRAVSVVVCTRDRPAFLEIALRSLLAMDAQPFEVVVVDNASTTDATRAVVRGFGDPRVRVVAEPRPGLARARNRGVLEARHALVAFTDDDVVVDQSWLAGLVEGFAMSASVACVCGMVPSGELRTFTQAYFDRRVTWARSCVPKVYSLAAPPPDQSLFPFEVGRFGTGANFAMRRDVLLALGGFDEGLGAGSPTRGGEDIDMFVRVLLAGHELVYQPAAIVWHRHRADVEALRDQIAGYGVGLGAWITKLLLERHTAAMVVPRVWQAIRHAARMTRVTVADAGDREPGTEHLAALELSSVLAGPYWYLRARRAGARKAPLASIAP